MTTIHPETQISKRTRSGFEQYYSALFVVFLALALVRFAPLEPRIKSTIEEGARGDLINQVGYVLFFLAAIIPVLLTYPKAIYRAIPAEFAIFFVWAGVTLMWSAVPDIAARRLVLTLIIVWLVFLSTDILAPDRVVRLTTHILTAMVAVSIVACFLVPSLAVHQPGDPESGIIGDWRGVFYHKNIFGCISAIAVLLNINRALLEKRVLSWVAAAVCLGALIMSGSKTSMGVGALALTVMLVWRWASQSAHWRTWRSLGLATAPLIIVTLVWIVTGPGEKILLDPQALTGRGLIWQMMFKLITDHPLGGLGYQSVFQTGFGGVMTQVTGDSFLQRLSHAHNGYIEIAVSTGLIGLGIFAWALSVNISRPLFAIGGRNLQYVPVVMGIVAFALTHALTESGLADRDRAVWLFLLLALGVLRSLHKRGIEALK